jgi:hypothetical protein
VRFIELLRPFRAPLRLMGGGKTEPAWFGKSDKLLCQTRRDYLQVEVSSWRKLESGTLRPIKDIRGCSCPSAILPSWRCASKEWTSLVATGLLRFVVTKILPQISRQPVSSTQLI